jgi:O-antigen/teichoic acid export membrane protein
MRQAVRILLAVAAPAIAVVLALGGDLLALWVGEEFRHNSTTASRWIAIGILFNIAAQVPLTALHGIGRTDVTAKIFCAELLFYALLAWLLVRPFGIDGIACAWATRAGVDAVILFATGDRILPGDQRGGLAPALRTLLPLAAFLAASLVVGIVVGHSASLRIGIAAVIVALLLYWEWRFLLLDAERATLVRLRSRIHTTIFTRGQP